MLSSTLFPGAHYSEGGEKNANFMAGLRADIGSRRINQIFLFSGAF